MIKPAFPSICFQTVEQIEVVKEVVLPEVSKLNDSVISKYHRNQTSVYSLSAITQTNKQTNKQTIYSFNDIQAPGLHIIEYYNVYKAVITMMIVI